MINRRRSGVRGTPAKVNANAGLAVSEGVNSASVSDGSHESVGFRPLPQTPPNGRLRAWCRRFSSTNATVAPCLQRRGAHDRRRRPLFRRFRRPNSPRPWRPGRPSSCHAIIHFPARDPWRENHSPLPSDWLFLDRWENGRWPPSTIKQITGCAYGFRYADPPFFRLIAAPARPFKSHQE